VSLGDTLNLEVVAEGIELSEQWNTLRDLGCDKGQGFFFARPMDSEAVVEFLATVQDRFAAEGHRVPPRADAP
jgi:EAL domain-containing protein (putative c-di-GMP-specific phosphodiesterase class I)